MKIAVLMGNRFSPWHLAVMWHLPEGQEIVAFRAESEIQRYFAERGADDAPVETRPIYFDHQAGPFWRRLPYWLAVRYRNRTPRLLPFHDQLRDVDVIHTWELFTDWTEEALAAKEKWGVPVCVMVWDNIPFNNESSWELLQRKQRCIAEADRFVVHTERSRRMLILEGVAPERIVRMDHGLDLERFQPGSADRAALGLAENEFVLLFVGWFLPRKGLHFLLMALRELIDDPEFAGTRFHLVIVGSGPGRVPMETLAARLDLLNHCTFAGSQTYDAMPAYYRAADAFVLPSIATDTWQEQFGMALMEALACGVPTVTTWSGAIPEIVEDAALLAQPNDFLALKERLGELVRSPERRAELAVKGPEVARRRFALPDYGAKLGAVYAGLRRHRWSGGTR